MKIAIDVDEVISSTLDGVISFYNEKTNSNTKKEDYIEYDWSKIWNCSKEEMLEIWNEFAKSKNHDSLLPVKDAILSINSLMEKEEITILTARSRVLKSQTLKWLKKYFPDRKLNLVFTGEFGKVDGVKKSKGEICNDLGISLMVEDNGEYALNCAESGIRTILFDMPWNQDIHHKNIARVSGWKEALKVIDKIQKDKTQ